MDKNEGGNIGPLLKAIPKVGQSFGAKAAQAFSLNKGIQPNDTKVVLLDAKLNKTAGAFHLRKNAQKILADVVVAKDHMHRERQRLGHLLESLIFTDLAAISQIAGDDHHIRPWIHIGDALERLCRHGSVICVSGSQGFARFADMKIGKMRYDHGRLPSSSTATGSLNRPRNTAHGLNGWASCDPIDA